MMQPLKIYLDFDGTVVEHEYPKIGRFNPNAMEVIKMLQEAGHTIILNTMRSEFGDGSLEKALNYINFNVRIELPVKISATKEKITPHPFKPEELDETSQVLYIDDQQSYVPLTRCAMTSGYMVNWIEIERVFREFKIIK